MDSKNSKTVFDMAADERKFLHDVANPLAVAGGMLEAFRGEIERSGIEMSEPMTRKLGKIETALDRMGTLLKERRLVLIAAQGDSKTGQ
jgi:signal transduction histidine kinase